MAPTDHRGTARARRAAAVALALVLGGGLAGCASDGQLTRAMDTAASFVQARGADPAAACELLAPATRQRLEEDAGAGCADALQEQDPTDPGRRLGGSLAGHSAQVRFAQDTLFLALFDDGWKVVAAGCERPSSDADQPYDCDLEGE